MIPRPIIAGRRTRPRSGGFVFLVVLLLMVVGGILIVATLDRAAVHHALVEKQVEGYRRHHELLGVRDIVKNFLLKQGAGGLAEKGDPAEPVARMVLEGGQVVVIYLKDGQGTVLRDLTAVPGDDARRWLIDILSRLPPGRDDLTRRTGPWGISLHAASDEVLTAIAAGDESLAASLIAARDDNARDISDVLKHLESSGSDALTTHALTKCLVFAPNLWRLDVELINPDETVHRYVILIEHIGGNSVLHEWRALPDTDRAPPGFGAEPASHQVRNGRAATIRPKTEGR